MSNAPDDDYDAGQEANLGRLSDEAWLEAHRALIESGALPAEQTRFLYDPSRSPDTVSEADLTEDGVPRG